MLSLSGWLFTGLLMGICSSSTLGTESSGCGSSISSISFLRASSAIYFFLSFSSASSINKLDSSRSFFSYWVIMLNILCFLESWSSIAWSIYSYFLSQLTISWCFSILMSYCGICCGSSLKVRGWILKSARLALGFPLFRDIWWKVCPFLFELWQFWL